MADYIKHELKKPYSNLAPQSYGSEAVSYIPANSEKIALAAKVLGVSTEAVEGSIAREITRSGGEKFFSKFFHVLAVFSDLHLTTEHGYESEFSSDTRRLQSSPGAFDGSYGMLHQFSDIALSDVGPGKIKILTAFRIIDQYGNTAQGKALGIDKYNNHDLKQIVEDLDDPKNPLSVRVAALVILNGQNFFSGKTIDGIAWSKLTAEQQDAALTAYYTIGEHAVETQMKAGQFRPFKTGPGGGEVGPWILFGDNYANLKAIGVNRAGATVTRPPPVSVAPIKAKGGDAKNSSGGSGRGDISMPVRPFWSRGRAGPTVAGDRGKGVSGNAASFHPAVAAARSMTPNGAAVSGNAAMAMTAAAMKARHPAVVLAADARKSIRASGQTSLVPARGAAPSGRAQHPTMQQDGQERLGGEAQHRPAPLPSVAPIKRRNMGMPGVAEPIRSRTGRPGFDEFGDPAHPAGAGAKQGVSRTELAKAVRDLFDREAMLPPSGVTGFDAFLTPAWPGLQLPA